MYNNFFIIDAHCHIFPDEIARPSTAAVQARYGVHSTQIGTVSEILEVGTAAGIDGFIVESVAISPKMTKVMHTFVSDAAKQHPDRFVGLGTFHPLTTDPEGDVNDAVAKGLHGFKIHPDMQGFKADHEGFLKLYELAGNAGLPVMIHTGDNRYDFSNPDRMAWIYEHFPNTQFVGAHFSGYTVWDEATEKLAKFPNVSVDLSSTYQYLPAEHVTDLIRAWGVERVMYGCDYPMETYGEDLKLICASGLSRVELMKIFSQNACRIYGIK